MLYCDDLVLTCDHEDFLSDDEQIIVFLIILLIVGQTSSQKIFRDHNTS